MEPEAVELIKAGLALDPDERAVVANRLLASLHEQSGEDQAGIDAAWRDEIARRLDEVTNGSVAPIDADEHYAQLRARIAAGTE